MISEEFSTARSTMTIIDSEERALGPLFVFPVVWLHNIENDADPVLIIVPDESLISICGIAPDHAIAFIGAPRLFMIGYLNPGSRLQGVGPRLVLFRLLLDHLVDLGGGELLHLLLVALVGDQLGLGHGLLHLLLVVLHRDGVRGQRLLDVVRVRLQLGHHLGLVARVRVLPGSRFLLVGDDRVAVGRRRLRCWWVRT